MTVVSTTSSDKATGNGATTAFPFDFAARSASEVAVYVNGALTLSGYTVALNVGFNGGTVTFTTAPANGAGVIIASNPSFEQTVAFQNSGPYNPASVDSVNDEAAIRDIFLLGKFNRALLAPLGETLTSIPALASRQNMLLGFDSSGNPFAYNPSSIVGSKGDPGGNVMAIGLFTGAGALTIPAGTNVVRTTGYSVAGKGVADYVYSAAVNAAYVTANPHTSFVSANGLGFTLSLSQRIAVTMFGAVGDGATDDSAAFTAALAFLLANATTATFGYSNKACPALYVPAGHYYLNATTLDITATIMIYGDGGGFLGGPASILRWADGTTGIRTQDAVTSGATGPAGANRGYSASGSIIRDLYLRGGYGGAESEHYGIHLRAFAIVEGVYVDNFPGDGIYANTSIGDGTYEGNASESSFRNCTVTACRNGFYFHGSDSNASSIIACDSRQNRQYGYYDSSFLGNYFEHCRASTNGWVANTTPTAATASGNRYYVKAGQAAAASTNAPSGTTADTAVWGYIGAGGTFNGVVAWVNGTTFREGGSYKTDNANAHATFHSCYSENDQNPPQIQSPSTTFGGILGGSNAGNGLDIGVDSNGGLVLGIRNGIVSSSNTTFGTTGANHILQGQFYRYYGDSAGVPIGSIGFYYNTGNIYDVQNAAWEHLFRVSGSNILTIDSTGLKVVAGALGYGAGAGGAVTQLTSRTTGVTINKACGAITLFSAAGSAAYQTFTVTNSQVGANDVVHVSCSYGTDNYIICTKVRAGQFDITFATTGGTTTEQPVFNFAVIKGAIS